MSQINEFREWFFTLFGSFLQKHSRYSPIRGIRVGNCTVEKKSLKSLTSLTSQTCETCETYRLRYNPAKPIIKEVREIIFFRESQRMDGKVEYVEKV